MVIIPETAVFFSNKFQKHVSVGGTKRTLMVETSNIAQ